MKTTILAATVAFLGNSAHATFVMNDDLLDDPQPSHLQQAVEKINNGQGFNIAFGEFNVEHVDDNALENYAIRIILEKKEQKRHFRRLDSFVSQCNECCEIRRDISFGFLQKQAKNIRTSFHIENKINMDEEIRDNMYFLDSVFQKENAAAKAVQAKVSHVSSLRKQFESPATNASVKHVTHIENSPFQKSFAFFKAIEQDLKTQY